MLRDRIARALPAWHPGMPSYHAILGMHAFGLEETGDYRRAEAQGRMGVELEPRDGWAQHAVAHVMEMQGRQRDGIAWMMGNADAWAPESFFAVHNWWHLALYHLDLGEIDDALELFDGPIYGARSPLAINMVDASALLWRLHLGGIDVGPARGAQNGGHGTGSDTQSMAVAPESGTRGCFQHSTGNDTMIIEYSRCIRLRTSSGMSSSGNLSQKEIASSARGVIAS
jgi:hypothetical protein